MSDPQALHADRSVFEGIETATVLKPGDRVLITVSARWRAEELHLADDTLTARFPDVEFTFVTDADVTILPGSADG